MSEMKKYRVKVVFKYSDVVHVEAESEREAVEKALECCQEEYGYSMIPRFQMND